MTETSTTPSPAPAPDPRPLLWRAIDQAERQVLAVTIADLDRPTPCPDWTVRQLLGHLVAVQRRIAHIAGGGQPLDVTSMVTDVADADWADAWQGSRTALAAALADDQVLDRTIAHPAGMFPGRQAIFAYVNEITVHSWDLTRAIGREDTLDDQLSEASLGPILAFLPAEPRGGPIPFGPVVEVPADAPAYDRLLGWMGRDPSWHA